MPKHRKKKHVNNSIYITQNLIAVSGNETEIVEMLATAMFTLPDFEAYIRQAWAKVRDLNEIEHAKQV